MANTGNSGRGNVTTSGGRARGGNLLTTLTGQAIGEQHVLMYAFQSVVDKNTALQQCMNDRKLQVWLMALKDVRICRKRKRRGHG